MCESVRESEKRRDLQAHMANREPQSITGASKKYEVLYLRQG